ncbi:BgTH12-05241 [Blumeria graminis f. sp. triticale]|uniref:BgtE-5694 n=3 Tax=Blumeria graminis TaxID=34373 RepID=A0A061HDR1_BLUGR|nr:putative secreted effector protein [Blumeria graminis f. sp. tritici 96224]CAD6502651.1 BgTH12-05241 [Blumeria graminis f. sp. triticale]VDB88080.1 BgtE-5694 [Blumeria graminis f. sp. tritici]
MVCLLAFLLYTGTELQQKDRFVITSFEKNQPSYQSYEVNYQKLFPEPDKISGIHSTLVEIDGPGTYLTVYCSNKMSTNDLEMFISRGLTKTQFGLDMGFSNELIVEQNCFNYVYNLYFKRAKRAISLGLDEIQAPEPDLLPVSWLIQPDQCTKRVLISLAYQRSLLCADGFGFWTTFRDEELPTIKFDEPVEIAATVLEGQMIMRKTMGMQETALGWNQGKLQIFSREMGSFWNQGPSVFEKPSSGWIISEFVRNSNAQVKNFMKRFDARYQNKEHTSECLGFRKTVSLGIDACQELRNKNLRVKLTKLSPSTADGYLDGVKFHRLKGIH